MEHGRSSSPEVQALLRRVDELTALVTQQQATIFAYHEQFERQQEQIALLKRALFGARRERYLPSPDQKLLFASELNLDEGAASASEEAEPDEVDRDDEPEPAPRRRSNSRRFVFPEGLPHRRLEYKLEDRERACTACHQERVVIGQHVSRQLELEPAQAYVVEHVRYTYACAHCRSGDQLHTTAKPPQPIEKSPFGASVLATIVVDKFARHLPLYRQQESLLGPLRTWLSRPLLCRLVGGTGLTLRPLVERVWALIFASHVVQGDETPVRYLDGTSDHALRGYLWGFAGDEHHRYVAYDFQDSRSRDGPRALLATYHGYLQSDGYAVYESLVREAAGRLTHVGCWAHARRKFDECLLTSSQPLVHEALSAIARLYDVEDQARARTPAARQALRHEVSRPIVERLHQRFVETRDALRPTSKLAEAIAYALNRWPSLVRYLDDGQLSIDTNHLERQLRPIAVGRANWLFLGRARAGATAATIYTVVQSARLHQVDLLPYLTDVLRRLPAIDRDDTAAIDALLPDHWLAAHPEHRLLERQQESHAAQRRRRFRRAARRLAAQA